MDHSSKTFLVICLNLIFMSIIDRGRPLPREGRLSETRNVGLSLLKKIPKTEFVVMIDMDILGWDLKGVLSSFKSAADDWDVVCANGIVLHGVYRDTYAFRVPGLDTNHHWVGQDYLDYNLTAAAVLDRRVQLHVIFSFGSLVSFSPFF